MALKSNRVGVRTDQVDEYGRVISKSFFQSLIDHLPRWTSLKVWKNGTEQLMPVNTDEPVTSPLVADIQYPADSSATEQMFTYRETPTDADGEAYIQSIKGNTLVWNQLYQLRSSGADSSENGITRHYGNENLFILNGTSTNVAQFYINSSAWPITFLANHKYLFAYLPQGAVDTKVKLLWSPQDIETTNGYIFVTPSSNTSTNGALRVRIETGASLSNYTARILMFDLTRMFGSGNEPTTVEEFTALFPLPYYKYDAGSLLSFNGTSIRTVGFNQWDEEWEVGAYDGSGQKTVNANVIRSKNKINVIPNTDYYFYYSGSASLTMRWVFYDANEQLISSSPSHVPNEIFTTPNDAYYMAFNCNANYGTVYKNDMCINLSGDQNGIYEPYTASTTTIPTDTYFPTGMKSVGTVYDEFNSSRAYTRIGEVDLGTLTWGYNSSYGMNSSGLNSVIKKPSTNNDIANILCPVRNTTSYNSVYNAGTSGNNVGVTSTGTVTVNTTETNSATFKTAMSGVYLYYELAEEIIEPTLEFDEE